MQRDTLDIRDSVLDRVVSYLEARRIDILWIDVACIDQANPDKKAEAINSMDLVYKNATKSIGLLTTPIHTSTGARLLGLLLDGNLSYEDGSGNFHFWQNTCDATVIKVIRILQDLVRDSWWERAWIYQEEYLSGLRMDLLIPVRSSVQVPEHYDPIPGEFCVQATKFREQVSVFLLACSAIKWKRYHVSCSRMLKTVGKYSITLRRSDGALKPMSATIFADIQRRGVENAWDTLAITANTCAYRTRLNVQGLILERRSLSLCLLAQFLLNGEIFICSTSKKGAGRSSLQHTIDGLLHRIQPKLDNLPTSTKELTFLKCCRLPPVRFCAQGLETYGYIWELPTRSIVRTDFFRLPKLSGARRNYLQTHPWESLELKALACELKRRQEAMLAAYLCTYIGRRRNGVTSAALDYMDLMACKLFQAIDRGYRLRLANIHGQCASGIFVPRRRELSRPMHVLTTWQPPRKGLNEAGNAVSLRIRMGADRVVRPTRWINGMVFFSRNESEDVLIGWPLSWMRQAG
jgi:hypothetical protein